MKIIFTTLFVLFTHFLLAQTNTPQRNEDNYFIHIKKATGKIVVDGKLDEEDWNRAEVANNFKQNFPYDSSAAAMQTVAKITFDDQFLYISGVCYQPQKYVVQSLRRDYPNGSSDVFFVLIDPFRDNLNGFYFSVTPFGAQKEGLIFGGADNNFDWDNKWYCESVRNKDYYSVEMAIPFKTLRYKLDPSGKNEWNINFARNNLFINERSSWAPIPRNFRMIDINFSGRMLWDEPPPFPGKNFSIIPFGLAGGSKNFIKQTPVKKEFEMGMDAKIAITPALNLDLTVNPDFAQVEVDRQITNLSRFELFFPERRQFFLENNDLFGNFGSQSINPFFSRRIGLSKNPATGENTKVPILAGARFSGRINKDWRVGVLNMQTGKFGNIKAANFTTLALERRVGARSNIGLIVVNKDELNNKSSALRFNRVIGMDYNLASKDSRITGKLFLHKSFAPQNSVGQIAMGQEIQFTGKKINLLSSINNVGKNFIAEVGYVPRNGFASTASNISFVFYPKNKISKWINNFRMGPDWDIIYGKNEKRVTDWDAGIFYRFAFQSGAELNGAFLRHDYTYLFSPFDPTNQGGVSLPAETSYTYRSNRFNFRSNQRKSFYYSLNGKFGEYFNGTLTQMQTTWSYRAGIIAIISLDVNYTKINLPQPYSDAAFWLIGPKAEFSFSRSVFFNAFLQYNNQINNFNLNARFQWRFKPVSDFFIVYTDNYFASDDPQTLVNNRQVTAFMPKNRAIVAKLTYWLNL